ncbi:hypothetical protein ABIB56_000800 [Glaciihabitans sp. UYNi722]
MARRDRLIRDAERERFLVTLVDGEAFDGILVDWDEGHFVLADADSISANGDRLRIDNSLWLPRSRIKYMQRG